MGGKGIQETETKCNGQAHFLGRPQLQFPDLRHRQEQDDQVGGDSGGRVGDPRGDLVDAVAGQLRVPEFLDRDADEDEEEGDGDDPADDEGSDAVGPALEVGEVEDAVVHEEDADLGPDEVEDVEDLRDDEEFGDEDDVVGVDCVGV